MGISDFHRRLVVQDRRLSSRASTKRWSGAKLRETGPQKPVKPVKLDVGSLSVQSDVHDDQSGTIGRRPDAFELVRILADRDDFHLRAAALL